MVSPTMRKNESSSSSSLEINKNTKKLFQVIYKREHGDDSKNSDDSSKIKVSSLVSKLSFFYEKARNAIDYEEDHLLRKNAISRILKRQIIIEGFIRQTESRNISEHLLTELIRGGYLANNEVPEKKIDDVALVLEKYIRLKNIISSEINYSFNLNKDINDVKHSIGEKNKMISWLIILAACEIEENLSPNKVKKLVVENMFDTLDKNIELPIDLKKYQDDLSVQIYLSIARKYEKFDDDLLSFVLFKYYNPDWIEYNKDGSLSQNEEKEIDKLAKNIEKLYSLIDKQLNHPLKKQLDKISRMYSLYYTVLIDTISKDPLKIFATIKKGEKSFFSEIKKTCKQKYDKAKSKLWRSALRSIIYIFLTKSIFVLLIEIPAIKWFNEDLSWLTLGINIAFPAVLLFFIVLTTRKPKEDNTNKIISGISEIIIPEEKGENRIVLLKKPMKRNLVASFIFNLVYVSAFLLSMYAIIRVLSFIGFTWVSMIIFLFFLAFVSFFSVITTKGVKELLIVEKKESLLGFLVDLFYMPIILVGRWLSSNMSKVNVFVFVFDFIIEAPFKILVDIFEDWTKYVKEKGENIE
ncbi:MAG: hypothetical protein PF488_03360 [Patescibacteria group bacterium]|jgi:hypothetical protein|nr:hypothetical protein [Patescibacteria group bacterium]